MRDVTNRPRNRSELFYGDNFVALERGVLEIRPNAGITLYPKVVFNTDNPFGGVNQQERLNENSESSETKCRSFI